MSRFETHRSPSVFHRLLATGAGLVCLTGAGFARAEEAPEESPHRLLVRAGLGVAASTYEVASDAGAGGIGFYGSAEYIYERVEWATPRAYAGVLIAGSTDDCAFTPCDVSARIGFIGVKGRLLAPIPYVAPFIELGIGFSVGSLRTLLDGYVDESSSAFMYHVPFAFGLALGKHHEVEVVLQFLAHPEQNHSDGGFAIGLEFPLE
jgi:hypothetical protein